MINDYEELWLAMKETKYTSTLKELQEKVNNATDVDAVLSIMLEIVVKAVHAECGTLWYYDILDTGYIYPRVTCGGANLDDTKLLIGDGIAGNVIKNNQPYIISNCEKTFLWNRQVDDTTGFKTKSMICVPLSVEGSNKAFAAIQIINKTDNSTFDEKDTEFATELAKKVVFLFLSKADEKTIEIIANKKIKLYLDDAVNQLSEKAAKQLLARSLNGQFDIIDQRRIMSNFLEIYRIAQKTRRKKTK